VITFALGAQFTRAEECTTGLAAPGATANRRALLWKNRDSSFRNNEIVRLTAPGASYLELSTLTTPPNLGGS
jgi:hypothetical protein